MHDQFSCVGFLSFFIRTHEYENLNLRMFNKSNLSFKFFVLVCFFFKLKITIAIAVHHLKWKKL